MRSWRASNRLFWEGLVCPKKEIICFREFGLF